MMPAEESFTSRVTQAIKSIPRGKVASYGYIAAIAGSPRSAIMVGQILRHQSERQELPWQRVINSRGFISIININCPAELQVELLKEEGVKVTKTPQGFWVDMKQYGWQPDKNLSN